MLFFDNTKELIRMFDDADKRFFYGYRTWTLKEIMELAFADALEYTELAVLSKYDFALYGDEAEEYVLNFKKYSSTDGQIVYVTPTGQKYHYSASCAGENAIKTSLYDVTVLEYEPCGNCAQ